MEGMDVDAAIWDAATYAERALTVLRVASKDVFRVSRYGKDEPTQADLNVCNHACRIDLCEASIMLEAVEAMVEDAMTRAREAQEGFAAIRKEHAA